MVKEEQILKLSGGGDWHVAYILLYAPRRLEKMKEEDEDENVRYTFNFIDGIFTSISDCSRITSVGSRYKTCSKEMSF